MPMDIFAVFEISPGSPAPPITVGETDADARSKGIPLQSFSMSVENQTTIGSKSGGAGAGKTVFEPITITRYVDSASPPLYRALFTGAHYGKVTFEFWQAGAAGKIKKPLHTTACNLVFITKIAQSVSASDERVVEEITLVYGAVEMKVSQQNKDGTFGKEVQAVWSQVLNQEVFNVE